MSIPFLNFFFLFNSLFKCTIWEVIVLPLSKPVKNGIFRIVRFLPVSALLESYIIRRKKKPSKCRDEVFKFSQKHFFEMKEGIDCQNLPFWRFGLIALPEMY